MLLLLIISLSHFPLEISRLRMSELLKVNPPPILFGERRPAFERVSPCVRSRLALRSFVSRPAFACASPCVRQKVLEPCWQTLRTGFAERGWIGKWAPSAGKTRGRWHATIGRFVKPAAACWHLVLPCQLLPKNRSHSCSKLGVKKPICIRSRMSVREKKRPSATSSEIFGLAWVRVVNTCTSSRSRLLSNT